MMPCQNSLKQTKSPKAILCNKGKEFKREKERKRKGAKSSKEKKREREKGQRVQKRYA
jgi:hypothetical protein